MKSIRPPKDLLPVNAPWFGSIVKHWLRMGETDISKNLDALRRNCPERFTGDVRPRPFVPHPVNREALFQKVNELKAAAESAALEYERNE